MATAGMAISMAVLIFTGELGASLPRAISTFMLAGGVMAVWVAVRSKIVPVATIVQDGPAIVMAAVAADFVARNDSPGSADVFVLLVVTSLVTTAAMFLLGRFRLGGLVRYIPTTVVGAFIAGTGWLLFKGGFEVMVGSELALSHIGELFTAGTVQYWLPGLVVGIIGWLLGKSKRVPAFAVGLLILSFLIAFFVAVLTLSSVEAAEQAGWLIGPFPDSAGISIVTPTEIGAANWGTIAGSIPGVASVVGLALVALLLNLTGIGSQLSVRIDVDAELRTTAGANLLVALFGVSPGYYAMGDTLLIHRLGARRRAVPMAAGLIMIVLGVVGIGALGYVPRLVVGALLIMVGFGLLESWVSGLRRSVHRVEQLLSVAILIVIAWLGILEGIGVGLVAACAVFIVRYSRVDPVRAVGSGREFRSRVDRLPAETTILDEVADQMMVFELQGYLFFGSLTAFEDRVRSAAEQSCEGPPHKIIIDFRNVTGIDTSGYSVIGGLADDLHNEGVEVIVSSLDEKLLVALHATMPHLDRPIAVAATLDRALELFEEQSLATHATAQNGMAKERSARNGSNNGVRATTMSKAFFAEFKPVQFEAGSVVMAQGTPSTGMMLVADGRLTAFHLSEDGTRHRLRRFREETIVGEMGVINAAKRSAEIVAETDVTGWWLSADRYWELRETKPDVIFELHELIMQVQSERVMSLSQGLARSLR